ncbi:MULTISPECIES: hypothetical protein [unclassified Brevibacterium]|uniref:hypothetical protein n=1 Tax=unclassified Brevibacterium TaxID=2614124 RepID=UPI000C5E69DD|nr:MULTISPECIES: hypothetical protein [unclassified Brevibacterium]SMX77128.1 hypothetical protein BSP239C_01046 [Brevibacterium sp. 239c]
MKLVASESLNFAVFRTAFEQGKELGEEEEITTQTLIESMQNFGRRTGVDVRPSMGWGTLLQAIYEEVAESSTVAPTFYTDFPETSPLTRQPTAEERSASDREVGPHRLRIRTGHGLLRARRSRLPT